MPKAGPVQYIVDERGKRKSVVMSYTTYRRLLEDIADLTCMEERKDDPCRDLQSLVTELRDAGRL